MTPNASNGSGTSGHWQEVLAAARGGDPDTLGRLLEDCRQYLLLVANEQLEPDLRGKVGASDVVQETFLEAQRDFSTFRGGTEAELLAWLRGILLNTLANFTRQYRDTQRRQLTREVPLADATHREWYNLLASEADAPIQEALAWEQAQALDRAMGRLPEHYREVLRLRYEERLSFEAIGPRLGRSAEEARNLWARAVEKLQHNLEPTDESPR
jgi:RNA polymerase sigma-70 factor (ECF subfamily)